MVSSCTPPMNRTAIISEAKPWIERSGSMILPISVHAPEPNATIVTSAPSWVASRSGFSEKAVTPASASASDLRKEYFGVPADARLVLKYGPPPARKPTQETMPRR